MAKKWHCLIVGCFTVLFLTSCGIGKSDDVPSKQTSSASTKPSASKTPKQLLTLPGVAPKAVAALMKEAGDYPALKLDISETEATLTVLLPENKVKTYTWEDNEIHKVDSDVEYVSQKSFNPKDFNLNNVAGLFKKAHELGTSNSNQVLQIVEYSGRVLMSVSTRPESATVFFYPDGRPIKQLDFEKAADIAEALHEAVGNNTAIFSAGIDPAKGLWIECASKQKGTLNKIIRNPKRPVYLTSRKDISKQKPFDPKKIKPKSIVTAIEKIRDSEKIKLSEISLEISYYKNSENPLMKFSFPGNTIYTDLDGKDVTSKVH